MSLWDAFPGRTCQLCRCTDERACITAAGRCWWITGDVCSACEDTMAFAVLQLRAAAWAFTDALLASMVQVIRLFRKPADRT